MLGLASGTTPRSEPLPSPGSGPLLAGLALAVPLARAVDQTVTATPSNDFVAADVTVDIGDTVTWTNAGGLHNVKFDDGSFEQPADPQGNSWTVSRTFDSAGTYRYYCELHGDINGAGMSGTVTVNPASTEPPPVPIPSPVPPPGDGHHAGAGAAAAPAEPAAPDTTAGGDLSLLHEPDPLPRWTRPHGRERLPIRSPSPPRCGSPSSDS